MQALSSQACGQWLRSDVPRVRLSLSRSEIGGSLGLTIETVSREIRHFESQGVIGINGRRSIVVPDLGTLRGLAEGELQ